MPIAWTHLGPTVLAAFLASLVEFVEALTVVLAVGSTRGWRPALAGTGAALLVLGLLVVVLGEALTRVPLAALQLVVGLLLLLFGLRWLRKAVLRAAGIIPLHNEAAAFEAETRRLGGGTGGRGGTGLDRVALGTAFNIVLLEGIEVVFIVVAVAAGGADLLVPASLGALAALLLVVLLGFALRRPLAALPENGVKFGVGVLLTAFGTFWVGEGLGLAWPGEDASILVLILADLVIALLAVRLARSLRPTARAAA